MSDTTALDTDVITEASNHNCVGMAVSVCLTPAAPSPLPMPYPTTGSMSEGSIDPCMRTKIDGAPIVTVGSCMKACHGNEAGTLKEVVSLNTGGPTFPVMGAPTVLIELGMAGITGSPGQMNKAITVGAPANASDASGTGGAGGGGGGGGDGAGGPNGPGGPGGGGGGGGGSADGASANGAPGQSSGPDAEHQCQDGHPVDVVSGAVVDEQIDLELPGLIPLVWKRVYSSLRANDEAATLGRGWAHGFEQRITIEERCVALREAEGRFVYFEKIQVGESTFHRRERLTLHRDSVTRWRVYSHATRRTSTFDALAEDKPARLLFIADAWGNALSFEYEGERLKRITDTAGRDVDVTWREGRITGLDVRLGGQTLQSVSYAYTRAGCLAEAIDPAGHADKFEYDARHRMIATTIKRGVRFQYEYDEAGRCSATWGPDGLYAITLKHDPATRTTWVDGEEPRVVVGDADGKPLKVMLPDGTVLEERAYDDDGYLIARANGAGEGEQFWYDARGNRVRMLDANGGETRWEYDERDLPTRKILPDGQVITFTHDEAGALVGVMFPSGNACTIACDAYGRQTAVHDARGLLHAFEYDGQNNLVAVTDGGGARTRFVCDALGRVVEHVDAVGHVTRAEYDPCGRTRMLRFPDGTSVRRDYDPLGFLARETDTLGQTTELRYTGMGVLSRLVTPDRRVWTFEYTSKERLAAITNPAGETYRFEYDQAGRIVAETGFDGATKRYAYATSGHVSRVEYEDGTVRELAHDRAGRFVAEVGSDGTRVELVRDRNGRIVAASATNASGRIFANKFERDALGLLLSETQAAHRVRYAYDALGRRTERVLPNGSTTRYAFDAVDRIQHIEHAGRQFRFDYDAAGRPTRTSDEAGRVTVSQAWDEMDRLVEQRAAVATPGEAVPRVLVQRRWEYDKKGRVARIDDGRWGTAVYAYDAVDQLVRVQRGERGQAFAYDAARSLVAALEGMATSGGPRWKVAAGNRLVATEHATYEYDARGRRTAKTPKNGKPTLYKWDARDRLVEVQRPDGVAVRLTYDALGRRVRKEIWDAAAAAPRRVVEYVWDGEELAQEIDSARGDRVFVHAPGTFVPVLQEQRGEVFVCVNDHLGMPKELLSETGEVAWSATHAAWGQVIDTYGRSARDVDSPFRLLGQVADDDTGLCWTRFRCFDPEVGRWLTADPLGFAGGPNLYAFDGNPLNDADPRGLNHLEKERPKIPDDAKVVRGGIATPEQLQKGVGTNPNNGNPVVGFSAQSAPGKSVEELAAHGGVGGGPFPHGKVSVTTAGELRKQGFDVIPTPGGGDNHVTVVTGGPLSDQQAQTMSNSFKPQPNPAKK